MHSRKLRDVMAIAEKEGLLRGERTQVVRGRMPEALVTTAKKRTGIDSDTELIEVALANIAVADDYADWLFPERARWIARLTFSSNFKALKRFKPDKRRDFDLLQQLDPSGKVVFYQRVT